MESRTHRADLSSLSQGQGQGQGPKASDHDETQRGLSVSTSKECGVAGPAFLTYFYVRLSGINVCKVIRVKIAAAAVKNHFCHRKYRFELFGLRKTWRYKAAKQNERRNLCRSFLRFVQRAQIA